MKMADRGVSTISSLFILSFLVAAGSTEYRFNGFRGSIIPNNVNNNKNQNAGATSTLTNTINQHNTNYNKPTENNMVEAENTDDLNNKRCVQKDIRDIRPVSGSCSKYTMCSNGMLITFSCPSGSVFNNELKACVPRGTRFDTCEEEHTNLPSIFTSGVRPKPASQLTLLCPRGATYKKAHPIHCARYYDCGKPAMMARWEDHEWECKYPFLFNVDTNRCEHYSMVSCGTRKIAYDRCEYKQYGCNGHSHCRPCTVEFPSCRDLPDGMNVWQGRTPSPYYVVCAEKRVVYSGSCPVGQLFDPKTGTCVMTQNNNRYW